MARKRSIKTMTKDEAVKELIDIADNLLITDSRIDRLLAIAIFIETLDNRLPVRERDNILTGRKFRDD